MNVVEYRDITGAHIIEYHHFEFVPKSLDEQIGFWYGYEDEELPVNASKAMQEAYAIGKSSRLSRRGNNNTEQGEPIRSPEPDGVPVAKERQDPRNL
ncbi:hypothetical protein [Microcystis sp. M42BS1]|uniref:hypothetical protein n=1 Tax=Microcystis sp. M42BS1 TaxID=2771192 RepID=UPI00258944E7|nr:hypothetical protein [Microcystis sp. M42BS1]